MIWLGLGSNVGDRLGHLQAALQGMQAQGAEVFRVSPVFETPAWGGTADTPFYNAVAEIGWQAGPLALLALLQQLETEAGRVRTVKWGNRPLDLDILEFHREQWQHERLQLPHPWYASRDFVLAPMASLEPDWVPTGAAQTVSELLHNFPDATWKQLSVRLWPVPPS